MGQAVGTAAALAVEKGLAPAGVGGCIGELQQALLRDDAYLPWMTQRFSRLTAESHLVASGGDPAPVRDGVNRPVGDAQHCWTCSAGDHVACLFPSTELVRTATLVLDSALDRNVTMSYHQPDDQLRRVPDVMPRAFRIEAMTDGRWHQVARCEDNHQRLVRLAVNRQVQGVRFVLETTWGADASRVFGFYVD